MGLELVIFLFCLGLQLVVIKDLYHQNWWGIFYVSKGITLLLSATKDKIKRILDLTKIIHLASPHNLDAFPLLIILVEFGKWLCFFGSSFLYESLMPHTPVFNKFICFSPVNSFCIILILRSSLFSQRLEMGGFLFFQDFFWRVKKSKAKCHKWYWESKHLYWCFIKRKLFMCTHISC